MANGPRWTTLCLCGRSRPSLQHSWCTNKTPTGLDLSKPCGGPTLSKAGSEGRETEDEERMKKALRE